MARNSFALNVDASQVDGLANRLGSLAGSEFGLAAKNAVNEVSKRFDETALRGMAADIGLTQAYIKSKTDLQLATSNLNPVAEISAGGDLTILGRYPLQQLTKAANGPAKGDPSRGIGPGLKQAGVKATIKRSAPAAREKWFTMRLRAGASAGANVGVFVRATGRKNPKHIYGPSPYSLFRHQIDLHIEEVGDDLEKTALRNVSELINKALA